ncbi:MAG: hypothetical protein IJ428_03830 [Clostridia bacterium]|nr:hypothetical protein [Clostridia bacterium]
MKKLAALFLALIMLVTLAACGGGADDAEILSELSALAPRATELYRIIYGDSLSHGEADEYGYCQVTADAVFSSVDALDVAMREVFYYDYYKILANTAFYGVAADEGEIGAKFIEKDGVMYVNPTVTEHFGEPREFDLTEAKVIKKNPYMAIVRIPHVDGDVEVTLQKTEEGWQINSPLF